jgi:nicotinamide riboside kinase
MAQTNIKRVAIVGPESTGKSTLLKQLSAHYQVPAVDEVARSYFNQVSRHIGVLGDIEPIARGQLAAEAEAEAQCRLEGKAFYLLDTCLLSTVVWSRHLYGSVPTWVESQALAQQHDLILLTAIDLPFAPDPQRLFPEPAERQALFNAMRDALVEAQLTYHLVQGMGETRTKQAIDIIDQYWQNQSAARP